MTGTLTQTWDHPGPVLSLAFSPDGEMLAGGTFAHGLYLWQVDVAAPSKILEIESPVWDIAFSPDGARLAAGTDSGLQLWSLGEEPALEITGPSSGSVLSVAFSPDGGMLAEGTRGGQTRVWEAETGRLIRSDFDHNGSENTE